jgi:hypothetical protein
MFHPNIHSVNDHFTLLGRRSGFLIPVTDQAAKFFEVLKVFDRMDDILYNMRTLKGDRRLSSSHARVSEILGIPRFRCR